MASPVVRPRLSRLTLARLPATVKKPAYDLAAVTTGIVHLGIGAFHRAHQAAYIDDILARGDRRWGIAGVSLRASATRDALAPQDGLYTLLVSGLDAPARVIGSVGDVIFAPEAAGDVLRRMSEPAVAIVSLTVTEKGYCHDPATGALDENHPLIVADLARPQRPRSAIGILAAAIERRRAAGVPPFTILSCDNLPANGRTLHGVLTRYATLVSPGLGAYIRDAVATPSTMVDRIVPATTDADRDATAEVLGVEDAWPVVTESFSQWVIEDRFSGERPEFEAVGVEMVADVAPHETMKLRLLNAAHSALAYLCSLAGVETVADAMAEPGFAAFVTALMEDASATLKTPPEADRARYRQALLVRFRNPALRHRLAQIAGDGSQKLPQRLLFAARDRLALGLPIERHALAVAAWMRWVSRVDAAGKPVPVVDPLAETLGEIAGKSRAPATLVRSLLAVAAVFGDALPRDERFTAAVVRAFAALAAHGSRQAAAMAAKAGH